MSNEGVGCNHPDGLNDTVIFKNDPDFFRETCEALNAGRWDREILQQTYRAHVAFKNGKMPFNQFKLRTHRPRETTKQMEGLEACLLKGVKGAKVGTDPRRVEFILHSLSKVSECLSRSSIELGTLNRYKRYKHSQESEKAAKMLEDSCSGNASLKEVKGKYGTFPILREKIIVLVRAIKDERTDDTRRELKQTEQVLKGGPNVKCVNVPKKVLIVFFIFFTLGLASVLLTQHHERLETLPPWMTLPEPQDPLVSDLVSLQDPGGGFGIFFIKKMSVHRV